MDTFRKIVIRVLLFPFSIIYGVVVWTVNMLYETEVLKASKFNLPVVGIGNLSIGGTGKTPHIEYLIEMLKDYINVATLSRGYKRETRGFRFVQASDTALTAGDEPLQYRRKYNDILVAVGESRAYAIPEIVKNQPDTQVVLLDDSYQHRAVQPGLNIILTAFDALFTDDYLLPMGRLREWRSGYKRADIIIVSKCPKQLSPEDRNNIYKKIAPLPHQKVYFSYFEYGYPYYLYRPEQKISLDKDLTVILLSAIANTDYLMQYLETVVDNIFEIEYTDHHIFDYHDIEKILRIYGNTAGERKIILTTEKDAMRLELHKETLRAKGIPVFVLPLKVKFHDEDAVGFEAAVKSFLLDFKV
ncbi:MAG TPA: tetraacyldisaccharide 4'-kinase [Saprospiraceae bacterium]|nr:tetraacyldisaccharide 4'-kinase [Saprospiraceae bacterium]